MTDAKDLMVAIIGAGVALGGLLLIFSGFLFAQAAIMPESTSDATLDSYKNFARLGLVPFAASLAVAGLAAGYFISGSATLADITLVIFLILVGATILYGIAATRFL